MNFRDLLVHLADNLQENESTDSRFLALRLNRPVREVSNSLGKAHGMGFLRRGRIKRRCLTSKGELCFKGREYRYSLSNQGRSYVKWLRGQKPIEEAALVAHNIRVLSALPENLRLQLAATTVVRIASKYRGPVARRLRLLFDPAASSAYFVTENERLKGENATLRRENESLEGENAELKGEKEWLKSELQEIIRRKDGEIQRVRDEIAEIALKSMLHLQNDMRLNKAEQELYRSLEEDYLVTREVSKYLYLGLSRVLPPEKLRLLNERIGKIEKRVRKSSGPVSKI